jgi:hypothetical protein
MNGAFLSRMRWLFKAIILFLTAGEAVAIPEMIKSSAKPGREVILSNHSIFAGRGDVWLVNFDPTLGTEIRKTQPAVIISSDAVGRLPIKLVAPITD